MNVAYFGTGSRRLFGIYEPPPAERTTSRGIVMCPAWGSEYLMSHRSLRQLALMLTARGMHVLRFDYFGTGDSAGDMTDASLAGCEGDICSAIDELAEISKAEQVSLLGLRLGADLAARVGARRSRNLEDLVIWDPVVSGKDYLAELAGTGPPGAVRGPDPHKGPADGLRFVNAWHFPISQAIQAELAGMDLLTLVDALPGRTLIATSEDRPALGRVREKIAAGDSPIQFDHIEGPIAWREQGNLGAAAVPVTLLQAIVSWLTP